MDVVRLLSLGILSAVFALAQSPAVFSNGVVDAATFKASVAPGWLVSIFGANLASQPMSAGAIPLPVALGGVSVTFNGIAAPLLYVSPGQINAQLPLAGGIQRFGDRCGDECQRIFKLASRQRHNLLTWRLRDSKSCHRD